VPLPARRARRFRRPRGAGIAAPRHLPPRIRGQDLARKPRAAAAREPVLHDQRPRRGIAGAWRSGSRSRRVVRGSRFLRPERYVAGFYEENGPRNVLWLNGPLRRQLHPSHGHRDARLHLREKLLEEASEVLPIAIESDDNIGGPVASRRKGLAELAALQ